MRTKLTPFERLGVAGQKAIAMSLRPLRPTLRLLRNALPLWLRIPLGKSLTALGFSLSEFGAWLRESD
jgi:hypothetical protein